MTGVLEGFPKWNQDLTEPTGVQFDITAHLMRRIEMRNSTESLSYRRIIDAYNDLLNQYNKARTMFLEYSIEKSTKEKKEKTGGTSTQSEISSEQYRALEEKLFSLQEELTDVLREKTQRAESLLQTRLVLRDVENANQQLKEKEAALTKKVDQLMNEIEKLTHDLESARDTIALLVRQRDTLENQVSEQTNRITSLEMENQQLLKAFLDMKQKEADEMNNLNENQMQLSILQKEVEYLRELLKSKEKGSDVVSNQGPELGAALLPTKRHKILKCNAESISVSFSKNNEYLAVGQFDKTIKVYSTSTYSEPISLYGCSEAVLRVAFSYDSQHVLGTFNDSVNIWNVQNGRLKHTLTGHTKKIYAGDFSGDNSKIVTGSHDRSLKVWDASRGSLIKTIGLTCKSIVNDLEISFPDNLIVSGHFDKAIRVHDLKTQKLVTEFPQEHTDQVTSINISKDSRYVLSLGRDNTLRVWDMRNFKQLNVFSTPSFKNQLNWNKAVFSPDASYIAAGGSDGKLYIWDIMKGEMASSSLPLKGHEGIISCVSWKPNGSEIASCGQDKTVVIYK